MDKYQNMRNVQSAKVRIKLGEFDLIYLLVMVLVPILIYNVMQYIHAGVLQSVLVTVFSLVFTIFCVSKSKNNPKEPNIKVMLYAVLMDQKNYYPLDKLRDYQNDGGKNSGWY